MSSVSHSVHAQGGHGDAHDDGRVHVHIAPTIFYIGIFAALIFLTFVTVAVSYFDFGPANAIVAVIIATMKAGLVATFFMHLNHDKIFHTIILLSSGLFLLVFIFFTAEDVGRRGDVDPSYGGKVYASTGERAPGGMPVVAVPAEGAKHAGHDAKGEKSEKKSEPEEKAHH